MPEGINIVPPLPHEAMAEAIAGTSSVDEDPPALGVHVEARAFRVRLGPARDKARGIVARRVRDWRILDMVIECSMNQPWSLCTFNGMGL